MRTRSPGLTEPLPIRPEKPRKSWFGRLTHWTGIAKAWFDSRALDWNGFEPVQKARSLKPGHLGAVTFNDVMTFERA